MPITRIARLSALALSFSVTLAHGQLSQDRLQALHQKLDNMKTEAGAKLPVQMRKALSGGALNFLEAVTAWQNIEQSFGEGPNGGGLGGQLGAFAAQRTNTAPFASLGPVSVSDPGQDFLLSLESGFTQSEASTAWCGNGVVVGFNDSGSFFESALFGPGGLSFTGAGASTDGGLTFVDIGYINPGSNVNNFLAGDPVVNCAEPNTFYFSQLGFSGTVAAPTSVVFLSKSTDGGFTWDEPIPAVSKDAMTDMLDKDWSTIDPRNPKNMYVSYTDFAVDGTVSIEIVHSTDGGMTWSTPVVLDEISSSAPNFPFVQGSQIAVDSHGIVYVEWERFPGGLASDHRELVIARSTNHAVSFDRPREIAEAIATGDGFALQGYFRSWLTGNLAVDLSGSKSDGNLYMTWEDGRLQSRLDLESPFGLYRNANVLISRSADQGRSWSPPVRVNNDPLVSPAGLGIDHFQPGVSVDSTGTVAVCWYDRRVDPLNYQISRFCGLSSSRAAAWTNTRVDPRMWPPIHASDALVNPYYLGDYDTVVSDKTHTSTGFQAAYGNVTVAAPVPNQDVFLVHLSQ